MAAPFELRPLTLGELLDRAFTIYRRHFVVLVGIMLMATLLPGMLMVGAMAIVTVHPVPGMILLLLYLPLAVLGYTAATAATTHAVSAAMLGEPLSIGGSFRGVRAQVWPVLGASLLMGLGITIGLVLLVVPGFIALVRWYVAVPTLVIERGSVESSLRRSWNLTQGSGWKIFLILLLLMSIGFAIGLLVVLPISLWAAFSRAGGTPSGPVQAIMQLMQYAANTLVLPIQSIVTVLLYYDLRIRREAFDVEHLMAGMGGTPPPSPTPLG